MIIRIWYLVRENDDDDEEDDCGGACLVLANRTCPRTGLHFTFSSRLHTGPSLNITYHWLRKTVWLVGNDQLFYLDNCLKNSLLHCLRKMQNATRKYLWKQFERIVWAKSSEELFENCLRQGYEEMFSTRLVTNYFQWIRSTLWQMFHWSKLRRISMGNF